MEHLDWNAIFAVLALFACILWSSLFGRRRAKVPPARQEEAYPMEFTPEEKPAILPSLPKQPDVEKTEAAVGRIRDNLKREADRIYLPRRPHDPNESPNGHQVT